MYIKWRPKYAWWEIGLRKKKLRIGKLNCLAEYYGVFFFLLHIKRRTKKRLSQKPFPKNIKCKYNCRPSHLKCRTPSYRHIRTHARKSPITLCLPFFVSYWLAHRLLYTFLERKKKSFCCVPFYFRVYVLLLHQEWEWMFDAHWNNQCRKHCSL